MQLSRLSLSMNKAEVQLADTSIALLKLTVTTELEPAVHTPVPPLLVPPTATKGDNN